MLEQFRTGQTALDERAVGSPPANVPARVVRSSACGQQKRVVSTSAKPTTTTRQLFSCSVTLQRGGAVVFLDGELDMCTAQRLLARLRPLAKTGRDLVVDVSGVSFFGSAGLAALTDVQRRATAAGGSMCLVDVPSPVWRMLALSGAHDRFAIVSGCEAWAGL
ncbi:MAG: rsbV [Mycobacterium sp.]|nr:rsbV [Mycobacterium sp.]